MDKQPEPVNVEHLRLAEVLDFQPALGIIRLHEQRVVILSAAAMGLLRKELIDTLGIDTARRLLLRFGYADGYHDAVSLRDRSNWADPLDGLRAGALLNRLEGIVRAEFVVVDSDELTDRFEATVLWHDSYVAEQHLSHYGKSTVPACWSLAGYASGYASACFRREIYFREIECTAQGAARCSAIGRDASSWNEALPTLRADFQSGDLGKELVHDFIRQAAARMKKDVTSVAADAMTALMTYHWPGNVRELKHAIDRAIILAHGTRIQLRELPSEVLRKPRPGTGGDTLDLQEQEHVTIERALKRFRGNRRQAADALKISTVTLWRKMKRYGIEVVGALVAFT